MSSEELTRVTDLNNRITEISDANVKAFAERDELSDEVSRLRELVATARLERDGLVKQVEFRKEKEKVLTERVDSAEAYVEKVSKSNARVLVWVSCLGFGVGALMGLMF